MRTGAADGGAIQSGRVFGPSNCLLDAEDSTEPVIRFWRELLSVLDLSRSVQKTFVDFHVLASHTLRCESLFKMLSNPLSVELIDLADRCDGLGLAFNYEAGNSVVDHFRD